MFSIKKLMKLNFQNIKYFDDFEYSIMILKTKMQCVQWFDLMTNVKPNPSQLTPTGWG